MTQDIQKKPLSLEGFASLFSHPKRFFSGEFHLLHPLSLGVFYLIWANSGVTVFGDFDLQHLSNKISGDGFKAHFANTKTEWDISIGKAMMNAFTGGFSYLYCLFWFYFKAYFCGFRAKENLSTLAAVYLYAEAVVHIPLFVHRMLQAAFYSDPVIAALDTNQDLFLICCTVLNVLSCLVGYQAVKSVFDLSNGRARLLFKTLPIIWCCVVGFFSYLV